MQKSIFPLGLCGLMVALNFTASAVVVTNFTDSGTGSLRQLLSAATNGTVITFATNGTISLTSGELLITNSLTIIGPGAANLLVYGNQLSRVFNIGTGAGAVVTPMIAPHDGHTATLLPDGQVMVVGGPGYLYSVSLPELYYPTAGAWTAFFPPALFLPPYSLQRFGHTATLLPTGWVLIAGGSDPLNSSFDSSVSQEFDSAGLPGVSVNMNAGRYNHAAALLTNGKVLVAGGISSNGLLASSELYDPINQIWTTTGSLNIGRESHTATVLANGRVLVVGGYGSGGPLASVELYNPTSGTWLLTNSLATARYDFTATLLTNGMVLVVGGTGSSGPLASVELFNPASGTWITTNPLTAARSGHTATLLANGKVLVAGGADAGGALSSVELLDPVTMTWTKVNPMTTERALHTATLLGNGSVLLAGGDSKAGPLSSSELYVVTAGITVNISGVTIRNGHAPDGLQAGDGGGIFNASTLNLTNCIISGNTAGNGYSAANNISPAGDGGDGGGIYNVGTLNLVGCTISGNAAGNGGNGMDTVYGSATVSFLNAGTGGNGGGIHNAGTLTVTTCTLSGNTAGAAGNNAVVGNGSDGVNGGQGGAIFNVGNLTLTASTLAGNAAGTGGTGGNGGRGGDGGNGGAIFSASSQTPATLRNGLFALNNAGAGGGDGGGGPGVAGSGPDLFGAFTSLGHNLVGKIDSSTGIANGASNDLAGAAAFPLNPVLGPLQNNGGPTFTMALLPGSPAIDAGDDALTGTDQRGLPRLSGLHVDIGAYELVVAAFSAPVISSFSAGSATQNSGSRLWSVSVGANVNAGGLPTGVFIASGPTTNYGSFSAILSAGYATTNVPVGLLLSGLMPGTIYHYRLIATNATGTNSTSDQTFATGLTGDFNGDGAVSQSEFDAVYASYLPTSPWLYITNTAGLGGTNVSFALSNSTAGSYSVQYSTNLVNWFYLGPATPRYGFTDTNAPGLPQRYYRLTYP